MYKYDFFIYSINPTNLNGVTIPIIILTIYIYVFSTTKMFTSSYNIRQKILENTRYNKHMAMTNNNKFDLCRVLGEAKKEVDSEVERPNNYWLSVQQKWALRCPRFEQ